jgi:hypothetical protein
VGKKRQEMVMGQTLNIEKFLQNTICSRFIYFYLKLFILKTITTIKTNKHTSIFLESYEKG